MVSDKNINIAALSVNERLNPCFNGIWSRTVRRHVTNISVYRLNLVLMEYGLGLRQLKPLQQLWHSLNPCFNGIWSRTITGNAKESGSKAS